MRRKIRVDKRNLLVLIIIAGIITFSAIFLFKTKFRTKGFEDEISINYKDKFNSSFKVCYGSFFSCKDIKPKIKGEVDPNKLGEYEIEYKYTYDNKTYTIKQKVKVEDKEPPVIEIESASVCPNEKINNVKYIVTDNYDGDITDKAKVYYKDKKVYIEAEDSSKNKSEKSIDAVIEDNEGPVITLKGNSVVNLSMGVNFYDEGATAEDTCDGEVDVTVENNVNSNSSGTYTVKYIAKDKSGNETVEERTVNVYDNSSGERVVYLTFDDGPSPYTGKLLDVLAKYNVKATFFVTGNGSDDLIAREFNEGHSVALHTNSHVYSYLYANVNNYYDDLNAVKDRVKRITGQDSNMVRFPGGSSNMISADYDNGVHIMSILTEDLTNKGYFYYDWNVDSKDAESATTADEVYENVISTLKEETSIVLQHDIKEYSVDAVERIIQYCLENGYSFDRLGPNTPKSHHRVFN